MAKSTSTRRPSVITKRTHIRQQKHEATYPGDISAPHGILDSLIVSVGYAGLAAYCYLNPQKFSAREIAAVSISTLAVSYGLYDFGKRNGMIYGASYALRHDNGESETGPKGIDYMEDYLRKEFRGQEFEDLKTPEEKIEWLRKEEKRIEAGMVDMAMACGQAYIGKEEAYASYEKLGAYGGLDWKKYNDADRECQEIYSSYEKAQNRLRRIREEIKEIDYEVVN
ncbi:hypothetical protein LOCC1_G007365 [Lachnellula occidentalis]|uniref:Uncharacterized protein n=1 Tax=Lachnellula occidentalis TaxID=215460 RepID=A0A8H8RXV4_9HELO|nr:hypothetical protein LOCC1_G007365 [Lachnellula occidentalis]